MIRHLPPWLRRCLSPALMLAASGLGGCTVPTSVAPEVADCEKAGGICVPQGDCAASGGTVPGASNCYSDEGPAECCVGSKAEAMATSCVDQGGICLPSLDCQAGHGYFSVQDRDCGDALHACCLPHLLCGDQAFDCCGGALYSASCDQGVLSCTSGVREVLGTCHTH